MTNKEIIDGLKYTMDMCLFDANTGEYDSKESLNDMTRTTYDACEGAIKALEQQPCIEDYPTCTECEHYDKEKHYCPRFCQVIKDTLAEAQPCEDCISREDILDYIAKLLSDYLYEEERERLEDFTAYIAEMPSVTPQRPKGKWIVFRCGDTDTFKCSECGMRVVNPYKYCPNCGVKMGVDNE